MSIRNITRLSKLFQPMNLTSAKAVNKSEHYSKSYECMVQYGIIKSVSTGMYALLPLGLRVLDKLVAFVDDEMRKIGAQKLQLPALTPSKLWKKTNRLDSNKMELFLINDRHSQSYILSPTYEETICNLISSIGPLSRKSFPLALYQISSKWRDEMKPRLGFLRSREFIMKDLYTFDTDLPNAEKAYESVCETYNSIFQKLGIPFVKAIGDTGMIGGLKSHEYHYLNEIGEDTVLTCTSCQYSSNRTVFDQLHCPHCKNTLSRHNAAEVGHAFLLDTKYSKPLKAVYSNQNVPTPLVMGCFGLGISRIISTAVEILSKDDELRWPKLIAPYTVCIIPPKAGSKEESASQYIDKIIEILNRLNIDAILDDRIQFTIGQRFVQARKTGYPYVIVIGRPAMQQTPLFEIHDVNTSKQCEIPLESIENHFINETK